jgi:transposase-like protein
VKTVKTRKAGRIVSVAVIVAVGVNTEGQREAENDVLALMRIGRPSRGRPG